MPDRRAACSCGQLHVTVTGEPVRISICHCEACQRRTGSIFGTQARFKRGDVSDISGRSSVYVRKADSGNRVTSHFCPDCGSTVYWELEAWPDVIAAAVGAFADPNFPAPRFSVYEAKRHGWALSPGELPMEHVE